MEALPQTGEVGLTKERKQELIRLKEVVLQAQDMIAEVNSFDPESAAKQFEGKNAGVFVKTSIPLLGDMELAVAYGVDTGTVKENFSPDLSLTGDEIKHRLRRKAEIYKERRGNIVFKTGEEVFSQDYSAGLVKKTKDEDGNEKVVAFGDGTSYGTPGSPESNPVMTMSIEDVAKSRLASWKRIAIGQTNNPRGDWGPTLDDKLPSKMFDTPFKKEDVGDFEVNVQDTTKNGGYKGKANNYGEALELMRDLQDKVDREAHGNVVRTQSITLKDFGITENIPPFGRNYVSATS